MQQCKVLFRIIVGVHLTIVLQANTLHSHQYQQECIVDGQHDVADRDTNTQRLWWPRIRFRCFLLFYQTRQIYG